MNKEFLDYQGLSQYDTKIKEKINSVKQELSTEINSKVSISEMKISGINNNGHEYVDLGLPSGTLWATMNIGANSVTDNGLYFSWGGTTGYANASSGKAFSWTDYELGNGGSSASNMTKYNSTDGKTVLEAVDDAAIVNMGGDWHMPTEAQLQELLNTTYVTNAWVTDYQGSGVNGRLFTSVADNTKMLFFPAAGICRNGSFNDVGSNCVVWSRSVDESDLVYARHVDFKLSNAAVDSYSRCGGFQVRGVIEISELDKYATNAQLSNYIQKSQTSGLLKNDGTVDTNQYLTRDEIIQLIQETINQ